MAKQWLKLASEHPNEERFKKAAHIREMFEYAIALLIRKECPIETTTIENTASYTLLIEILLELKSSPEDDSEYFSHGMEYFLSILRKISNEKLCAKILIQFIYFSSYFNKVEEPKKVTFI